MDMCEIVHEKRIWYRGSFESAFVSWETISKLESGEWKLFSLLVSTPSNYLVTINFEIGKDVFSDGFYIRFPVQVDGEIDRIVKLLQSRSKLPFVAFRDQEEWYLAAKSFFPQLKSLANIIMVKLYT